MMQPTTGVFEGNGEPDSVWRVTNTEHLASGVVRITYHDQYGNRQLVLKNYSTWRPFTSLKEML